MTLRTPRYVGFLLNLWLLVGAAGVRADTAPVYTSLDHVEFLVTDLPRSLKFYTGLFGSEVMKNRKTERRYLHLGSGYLAMEQQISARVDHVCFGVRDFNLAGMHSWLKHEELSWQDYPSGRDLRVDDRDGTRVQVAAADGWLLLQQDTASPEALAGKVTPLFHPLVLDEVFITVTNLEVDSLHYARVLGKTGVMSAGSLWFDLGSARLRLSQAPVGQVPGLNYFSVLIANTDLGAAAEAVFKAGGIIENILPNGFSFWDPDGLRVEVHVAKLL